MWAGTIGAFIINFTFREQLMTAALVPVITLFCLFINTFPTAGLKFTRDRFTFTPSDSIILLIICWHGFIPAVIISGIEGFVTSRRTVRRLSSNLFSASMMALATAAAAVALDAVLVCGFGELRSEGELPFLAVAVAMLVAGLSHITINIGLLSAYFAVRQGKGFLRTWSEMLVWVAPMFLPTGTIATLLYMALQYSIVMTVIVGTPILAALFFAHRQHRNDVQEKIDMMEKAHRETIEALAVTINAKDEVTHEHVQRVQIYATGVARLLGCTPAEIEALKAGALLHDIGKIAVPDYILNKPGKLTKDEFERMKLHTIVGAQILGRVEFPYPVVPIVRSHHERWDGRGYPDGLAGEDIPLTARILSVVDCFDAVREDRQYRKGMTREEAVELLMQGSGTHYDPRVVGTFITHLPQFEADVLAHKEVPVPSFGIEPAEELSDHARAVAPAAGLAETETNALPQLKHKELQSLYRFAQALNGVRDQAAVLDICEEQLAELLPFETCAITLVESHTGEFRTRRAFGEHADCLHNRRIGVGEGVTGWVLANRRSFLNTAPTLDVPPGALSDFNTYLTLAVFPLVKGDTLHGAVTLYARRLNDYTSDHERIIIEVGSLLATALSAIPESDSLDKRGTSKELTYDDAPTLISHDDANAAFESGMTH